MIIIIYLFFKISIEKIKIITIFLCKDVNKKIVMETDKETSNVESESKQENNQATGTEKKWTDVFKSINKTKNDDIVEKLQAENQILKNNLLIVSADLENTRKRQKEELEKTAKYAISKISEDLIPVMDAFYLAAKNTNEEKLANDSDYKVFVDGTNIIFNEFKKVFERYNIVRIDPLGEQFDHNLHQAISQAESEEEEGKIIAVVQAGYILNGRLIKPALVIVSKGNNK